MDDALVGLIAFMAPGAYFVYRWQAARTKKKLFGSYVDAIYDAEISLIDLASLVGRSVTETDRDLRELIGLGWYPGACIDRESYRFLRSFDAEMRMLQALGQPMSYGMPVATAPSNMTRARKQGKPLDPEIVGLVVECPRCGELNYRSPRLEACEFCGADLRGFLHGR